jgi:hypothetical protein
MSDGNPVSDLLRTTSQLTGLLDREAEMLRAMRPSEIQALHQDKLALAAAYESQIKVLDANPGVLRSIPVELRTNLAAKIQEFQAALSANQNRLRAAREATESTLRAIADEVQAKTEKHAGYSAKGATSSPREPGRTSALAFAFDQRL